MRVAAALLLLSLLAAFHAPLVAAVSGPRMDCCAGGMAECCPQPGSASMRTCRPDDQVAPLSTTGAFLVLALAAGMRPAFSPLAPAERAILPASEPLPVLDPPPRA